MAPGRLHALVDGIFAIAVTLLVLDLPRPSGSEHLARDLLESWPSYVAYLVSFVTVGVLWIEHTGMLSAVRTVNRRFIERTLLFLLFISVIPWPTALAAEYVTDGGAQARTVASLYAAIMLLMAASMTLSWRYLELHPELVAEPARSAFTPGRKRSQMACLVYIPALALALISPTASFALDGLVALYFALSRSEVPGLIARSAAATEA